MKKEATRRESRREEPKGGEAAVAKPMFPAVLAAIWTSKKWNRRPCKYVQKCMIEHDHALVYGRA